MGTTLLTVPVGQKPGVHASVQPRVDMNFLVSANGSMLEPLYSAGKDVVQRKVPALDQYEERRSIE